MVEGTSIANILKEKLKDINLDGNAFLELKENIILQLELELKNPK